MKSLYLRIQIYSIFLLTISPFLLQSAGMALCDMFTLLCPAPGLIYMLTLGNHNQPLSGVATCHAWIAFYEVSGTLLYLPLVCLLFPSDVAFGLRRCFSWTFSLADDTQHVPHRVDLADPGTGCSKVRGREIRQRRSCLHTFSTSCLTRSQTL